MRHGWRMMEVVEEEMLESKEKLPPDGKGTLNGKSPVFPIETLDILPVAVSIS